MPSPTIEYLNRQEIPKALSAAVDAEPIAVNPMVGCYSAALQNSKAGKSVVVVGGGEVYQNMIGPALKHLGVTVHLYDPRLFLAEGDPKKIIPKFGEACFRDLADAPRDIPVFILSPNDKHAQQARFFIERGQPIAVEKPACLPGEVEKLREVVEQSKKPTYWIDFNHMMGRSFIALADGVKMPFMDSDAIKVEKDPAGKVAKALSEGTPLIKGNIRRVTGRYFQAGNAPGGGIDHRQISLSQGGGMLRDLMTRLFNMSQLIGLENAQIGDVDLRIANKEKHGEYIPVSSVDETEHYASVKGTMQHGNNEVAYDFAVGKYAAKNDLQITIDYDTGDKLTLEWLPPNRTNRVTWRDKDDVVQGQVFTRVDPYMLVVLDALSHLESKEPAHLYFPEQVSSVLTLGKASEKGRQHLDPGVSMAHG